MSKDEPNARQSRRVRESLEQLIHELENDSEPSRGWGDTTERNRELWSHLKEQIHRRQRELKILVMQKRAGEISAEEFESRYRTIQDELTALEAEVYNLRLGTHVKI